MAKIEINGAPFSSCADRFCSEGYRRGASALELLERYAQVEGIDGFPIMVPLEYESLDWIVERVRRMGLSVGTVAPDTYIAPKWKDGALMQRDPAVRRDAVRMIEECMDAAAEFPGSDVLLWLANDGYDYPFEDDYAVRFGYLTESLAELCEYRPEIRLSLEYKAKEPRTHQYVSNYGKAMFICERLGYDNLGVVVDIGHSLFSGESPAEAVAITNKYGMLNHVHLNDNYRTWDDDLIVGSVHFWETLEMFFELEAMGYDGWFTLDIWPARADGFKAITESVERTRMCMSLAERLPRSELRRMQAENDAVGAMRLVRELTVRC